MSLLAHGRFGYQLLLPPIRVRTPAVFDAFTFPARPDTSEPQPKCQRVGEGHRKRSRGEDDSPARSGASMMPQLHSGCTAASSTQNVGPEVQDPVRPKAGSSWGKPQTTSGGVNSVVSHRRVQDPTPTDARRSATKGGATHAAPRGAAWFSGRSGPQHRSAGKVRLGDAPARAGMRRSAMCECPGHGSATGDNRQYVDRASSARPTSSGPMGGTNDRPASSGSFNPGGHFHSFRRPPQEDRHQPGARGVDRHGGGSGDRRIHRENRGRDGGTMWPRVRRMIWQQRSQGTCVSQDTRTQLLGLRRAVTTRRIVRTAADQHGHEVLPTARRTTWSHRRPRTHRGPSMRRPSPGVNTPRAWPVAECPKRGGTACTWHHPERGSITYGRVPWAANSNHEPWFKFGVP